MSKATSVTAHALYNHKGEGYEMLNRWVLSRDRQTATEGAEVTRSGRLFQTRAAATGKARSPTVESLVRLTISDEDELERSR